MTPLRKIGEVSIDFESSGISDIRVIRGSY